MLHQALKNLGVVGKYNTYPDGTVTYHSATMPKPTKKQIDAELINVKTANAALEYQQLRAAEYKEIYWDDLRFNDIRDGTTIEYDTRAAIKLKYPK